MQGRRTHTVAAALPVPSTQDTTPDKGGRREGSRHQPNGSKGKKAAAAGSRQRDPRAGSAKQGQQQKPREPRAAAATFIAWRVFNVAVPLDEDPGKDDYTVHQQLLDAIGLKLVCQNPLAAADVTLVRKTYDARRRKRCFSYVVDVAAAAVKEAGAKRLRQRPGELEGVLPEGAGSSGGQHTPRPAAPPQEPVIVVGSGPAGLFAALTLAESGVPVALLERGQPVEVRGRDIGALVVRRQLNPESNVCYGEGGAGTWSDGKLTTRIGRNADPVRRVLRALYEFGAPESVLVDGKPHIGTDRLVRILRSFRSELQQRGVDLRFGCRVEGLKIDPGSGRVAGVVLSDGQQLKGSAVVLAVGHSAHSMYRHLADHGVAMTAKPFAMGFRIEHPQALMDEIQYGAADAAKVDRGRGKLPVADYSLATQVGDEEVAERLASSTWADGHHWMGASGPDAGSSGSGSRGVYSFCMCPGGQIVTTSTSPDELCINGMSFSRRNSAWANSALVVGVLPSDWSHLEALHGPLAGVELQRAYEREAASRGGGNLVAPVQLATDFLAGRGSLPDTIPSSSYRLGVRAAPLHDLYAPPLSAALCAALQRFEAQLPGFVSDQAVLHGAETRTSAPVRVDRDGATCQSLSHPGLFPVGEGAGYAGGIVSAAVDGIKVAEAVLASLGLAVG